jgi:hypothetical protein
MVSLEFVALDKAGVSSSTADASSPNQTLRSNNPISPTKGHDTILQDRQADSMA